MQNKLKKSVKNNIVLEIQFSHKNLNSISNITGKAVNSVHISKIIFEGRFSDQSFKCKENTTIF